MATITKYVFTMSAVNTTQLSNEIRANASIIIALDHIDTLGTEVDVYMKDVLPADQQTALNSVITSHVPVVAPDAPLTVAIAAGTTGGIQRDSEGAPIQRMKTAPTGWTYQLRGTEFASSTIGSVVNNSYDGTLIGDATLLLYDSAGTLITDQATADTSCVKTVLDWEPTYSYEVIGGTIKFHPTVASDTRLSVIAVPDIPAASGGSKIMVCNVNLSFVDPANGVVADGRVSKRLDPSTTYHTNKLRLVINHAAGEKVKYSLFIEHYKL